MVNVSFAAPTPQLAFDRHSIGHEYAVFRARWFDGWRSETRNPSQFSGLARRVDDTRGAVILIEDHCLWAPKVKMDQVAAPQQGRSILDFGIFSDLRSGKIS